MYSDLALLALRVLVGGLFLMHGWNKVLNAGFIGWLESLKVPYPKLAARFAWTYEILGGALLILGYGSWLGPLLLISVMAAAIGLAHRKWNPDLQAGGWEYPAVLIAINIYFLAEGFGRYVITAV